MSIHRARVAVPLPGLIVAKRWGGSVYAYSRDWDGDVDLSRDPQGQDADLWAWMNELLWTCREWEVYGAWVDDLPNYVLARSKAAAADRGRRAAGLIEMFD